MTQRQNEWDRSSEWESENIVNMGDDLSFATYVNKTINAPLNLENIVFFSIQYSIVWKEYGNYECQRRCFACRTVWNRILRSIGAQGLFEGQNLELIGEYRDSE